MVLLLRLAANRSRRTQKLKISFANHQQLIVTSKSKKEGVKYNE